MKRYIFESCVWEILFNSKLAAANLVNCHGQLFNDLIDRSQYCSFKPGLISYPQLTSLSNQLRLLCGFVEGACNFDAEQAKDLHHPTIYSGSRGQP